MIQRFKDLVKYAAIAAPVYAQDVDITPKGQWANLGNITISSIISGAISLVMLIVALVFFFVLIWGGLKWVMSEGDQKAVESARAQITNALIGLAIVFAAFAIMKLIETIFGISLFKIVIPSFSG